MSETLPHFPDLPVGHAIARASGLSDYDLRSRAKTWGFWLCVDANGYEYRWGSIVDKDPQGRLTAAETRNEWGDLRTWVAGPPWAETTPARTYAQASDRMAPQTREMQFDRGDGRGQVFNRLMAWVTAAAKNEANCGGVFYLWGKPGRGKTVSVERALLAVSKLGVPSVIVNAAEAVDTLRNSYNHRAADAGEMADRWQQLLYTLNTSRILAVDDLGLGKSVGSQDAESMWIQMLDTRRKVPGLATIFTSNAAPDDVTREGRLSSRLAEGVVMELPGQDYRRAR